MLRFALVFVVIASGAAAQDFASADQIKAAIVGNTVMGNMAASGAYNEFYAPDGAIRAADYQGAWSIVGSQMCFVYGDNPGTCWAVRITADQVSWVVDGRDEGGGTILPGNPNGW